MLFEAFACNCFVTDVQIIIFFREIKWCSGVFVRSKRERCVCVTSQPSFINRYCLSLSCQKPKLMLSHVKRNVQHAGSLPLFLSLVSGLVQLLQNAKTIYVKSDGRILSRLKYEHFYKRVSGPGIPHSPEGKLSAS